MSKHGIAYRLGFAPWEGYGTSAAASICGLLDREEAERSGAHGRELDLGCGRGQYTRELARRGWQAVGVTPSREPLTPRAAATPPAPASS